MGGQGRDHTRLQDAVAACNASVAGINVRRIERMCRNGYQLAQSTRGQASVAVQSEDVADAGSQLHAVGKIKIASKAIRLRVSPGGAGRTLVCNKAYQCFEFAAFSLPANPAALGVGPGARAVDD